MEIVYPWEEEGDLAVHSARLQARLAAEKSAQPVQSCSSGDQAGEEGQQATSRWATLSLVPDRSVAGLVSRTWDKKMLKRPPRVAAKKSMLREGSGVLGEGGRKPQPGLQYGRVRRPPRPPPKRSKSTDTSSSSENGEESSCGEEEQEEQDEQMGAEEEDKKEICIQVKLGKEEKVKPCLEKAQPDVNWFIWDGIRGTRANQDYQREVEDSSLLDIQSHLASRRQGRLVRVASTDSSSYTSGGSFLKLEQDWRDSHLAYLQHKTALSRSSRPSSAGSMVSRTRIRTPTIR